MAEMDPEGSYRLISCDKTSETNLLPSEIHLSTFISRTLLTLSPRAGLRYPYPPLAIWPPTLTLKPVGRFITRLFLSTYNLIIFGFIDVVMKGREK